MNNYSGIKYPWLNNMEIKFRGLLIHNKYGRYFSLNIYIKNQ
jgi:hypothetical protein